MEYLIKNMSNTNLIMSSVLFTCGHDGYLNPGDVQKRNDSNLDSSCDKSQFQTSRDLYTSEITTGIAWNIYLLTSQQSQPPTVIEKYHRKYMDVNRKLPCAYEDQEAELYYYEYHGLISKYLKEMYFQNKDENLMSYLFDIHGYNRTEPGQDDIILGTENGKSVWKLLKNHPDAINDLITMLKEKNYSVFHATIAPTSPDLDGGYTINHYSSPSWRYACNAIQFEFADELRTNVDKRVKLTVDLAECIFQFVSKYPRNG